MKYAVVLAVLAIVAMKRGDDATGGIATPPEPEPTDTDDSKIQLEKLMTERQYNNDWKRYFHTIARHESGYDVNAVNTDDAWAAVEAYERNAHRLLRPREEYVIGSVGPFQMLPANALVAWPNDPVDSLKTWERSLDAGARLAKYLLRQPEYRAKPTWGRLLVGWGRPHDMGNAERLQRWKDWLAERGIYDFTNEKGPT